MKLRVFIPFLLTSFITFSQQEQKEMINLFDSIQAIEPYEQLYSQINSLSFEKKNQQNELQQLRENYQTLKEFFFRQVLYRKVFDQLELGIIPDSLEIETYLNSAKNGNWIQYDWTLFEIPKLNSKAPIIIFVDANSDAIVKEYSIFKGYPFTDFGLAFYKEDTLLIKQYPKVAAMIKTGKIVFSMQSLEAPTLDKMQIMMLEFPSQLFRNTNKSITSKNMLADNLLSWISDQAAPVIKRYYPKGDIVANYLKLEKEKLANASIDKKIGLRIKFIEFLKIKYPKLWK